MRKYKGVLMKCAVALVIAIVCGVIVFTSGEALPLVPLFGLGFCGLYVFVVLCLIALSEIVIMVKRYLDNRE